MLPHRRDKPKARKKVTASEASILRVSSWQGQFTAGEASSPWLPHGGAISLPVKPCVVSSLHEVPLPIKIFPSLRNKQFFCGELLFGSASAREFVVPAGLMGTSYLNAFLILIRTVTGGELFPLPVQPVVAAQLLNLINS